MRIVKFCIFIFVIMAAILSLFPEVTLRFVVFHLFMCLVLLFPYYFWVYSIRTAIITLSLVFLIAVGMLLITSKTGFSKRDLRINSDINLNPRMKKLEFNFYGKKFIYDFSTHSLKRIKKHETFSITPKIIKTYCNHVNHFIKNIDLKRFKSNKNEFLKYVLWVLYLVLFAFAFSYKPSIVVSYSIIFFTLPYALYLGSLVFFKDFSNMYFTVLKIIILLGLLTLGLIRAKT